MIAMAVEGLRALGLERFQLDVGQTDFFRGILEDLAAADADGARELRAGAGPQGRVRAGARRGRAGGAGRRHAMLLLALPTLYGRGDVLERAERPGARARARRRALANLAEVYRLLRALRARRRRAARPGRGARVRLLLGPSLRGLRGGARRLARGRRALRPHARRGSGTTARPRASRSRWAARCSPWSRRAWRRRCRGPTSSSSTSRADKTRGARAGPPLPRPRRRGGARHHRAAGSTSRWPTRGSSGCAGRWSSARPAGRPGPGPRARTSDGGRSEPRRSSRAPRGAGATLHGLRRDEQPCLTSSWSGRSGETRARARWWTCSRLTWTWSCATRAATTPATPWSWAARSSCCRRSPPASCTAGCRCVIGCGVVVDPASLIDEMESLVQRGRVPRRQPLHLEERAPDHAVPPRARPRLGGQAGDAAHRHHRQGRGAGLRRQGGARGDPHGRPAGRAAVPREARART